MKFVIKFLIISTLCSLSRGYSIETKVKNNFDGGVAMKVFNGKSKVKINKREHIDNVRDEHMPKSREDILNIKQLSYHGKMRPKAEPLIQKNTTIIKFTTTTKRPRGRRYKKKKIAPVNRADRIIVRKKFKPSQKLPSSNELVRSAITKPEKPNYIPYDTPFYPLMRPSPINVMPTAPPTFDTIRNYVQYLKMRNEKNYAEINDDDDGVSPLAAPLSHVQKKKSNVPYDGEVEYFQKREKEIFKEQQRNRSSDESNGEDNDHQHPYKVHEHNDNYDDMSQNESETSSEDYDDNTNDESRHDFIPFKLYAQVRHAEAEHIEPAVRPHVKEKVSLAKKNIYYKEEGYDDRMHDKGSEELKYKFKSKKKGHKRSKRSVDDLPLALALFKKSELPNLTGEKLLRHLDELIKNSSVYLSDDDDNRPVKIVSPKQSRKFPFHNLSENVLSQMSAHRYSENFHTYPQHKESLYSSKNIKDCHEINDEIDIEESEESPPPRRLKNLGSNIECLKLKYFGKDPFDNPLFKEDEYVAATIPLPFNHTNVISRQANPLINVYDDVIRTIRAENFAEEKKKNQEVVKDSTKLASEKIQIRTVTPRIPNYSSVAGVSALPLFDINKYLPKYRPSFNVNDDEMDITELLYGKNTTERNKSYFTSTPPSLIFKKPNRQNSITSASSHKIESSSLIEKPKVKRNFRAKSSERSSPLKAENKSPVTIQKFRRVTPHKLHSSIHPSTRASSYRFKFL